MNELAGTVLGAQAAALRGAADHVHRDGRAGTNAAGRLLSFAEAQPYWRQLERLGHLTPYQAEAWVRAWAETLGREQGATLAALLVEGPDGRVAGLLPLALSRSLGLTIARIPGGKHANLAMPLLAVGSGADPARWRATMLQAGQAAGIDLFALGSVPKIYEGVSNPLAACCGVPALSHAYSARLAPDLETFLKARMSGESRKKLRAKERKLAAIGPLSHCVAVEEAEILRTLDAFLTQKAARFASLGIADPFASATARNFLKAAALGSPAAAGRLRLHALMAGERILAVFGVLQAGGRASAMFTSFDADPSIARFSPGEVLLAMMIGHFCKEGLTTFDLGVGDGAYKRDYCETVEPLTDVLLPVTIGGRLLAMGLAATTRVKRAIKADPRLMALARRLRRSHPGGRQPAER